MAAVFVIALVVLIAVICSTVFGKKKQQEQYQSKNKKVFVKNGVNVKKQVLGEEKGEYFTGNLENEGTYFVNHAMKLWRISFDNFRTGQRTYMEFSGQMWIGRGSASQNSNVRLILSGDSKISRDHCTIYDAGRSLCIQDLKSSNHTYLNGKLVSSALYLKNGDVIRMGDTELKIEYSLVNNMYL